MDALPERFALAGTPTALQPMPRLGRVLGFVDGALQVKRDDLTALAGGGNKARKLEFLVAEATALGCDVLVTGGAPQSNHVRMAAAAAGMAGLGCVAVLGGPAPEPDSYEGNLVLDALLGAEPVWVGEYDAIAIERALTATADRLRLDGRRPYEIPLGGASPLGCLGYVLAADELAAEAPADAVVYAAAGTGGTHAGLAVGFGELDRVRSVDVGAVPGLADRIEVLLPAAAVLAGRAAPTGTLQLDGSQVGAGYGARTEACREAILLAARHEGLLLDPVYSGKALAGLIADRRSGRIPPGQPVVFVHTGGLPTLFVRRYRDWLVDPQGAVDRSIRCLPGPPAV